MSTIEVTNTVTDAYAFELRVGDRVRLASEGEPSGTVVAITPSSGALETQYDDDAHPQEIRAQIPPKVTVRFDSGAEVDLEPRFLRSVVWRWNVLEVIRAQRPEHAVALDALAEVHEAAQDLFAAAEACPIPLTSATAMAWDGLRRALLKVERPK